MNHKVVLTTPQVVAHRLEAMTARNYRFGSKLPRMVTHALRPSGNDLEALHVTPELARPRLPTGPVSQQGLLL